MSLQRQQQSRGGLETESPRDCTHRPESTGNGAGHLQRGSSLENVIIPRAANPTPTGNQPIGKTPLHRNRSRVSEGDRPIFAGGREFNGTLRPPQPVVSAVKMRQSPARERLRSTQQNATRATTNQQYNTHRSIQYTSMPGKIDRSETYVRRPGIPGTLKQFPIKSGDAEYLFFAKSLPKINWIG
jgi:hypothetical protein